MIGYISWNPPREALYLPFVDFPVYWYSIMFAIGFYGAMLIVQILIRKNSLSKDPTAFDPIATHKYSERLAIYCFFGMLIGARLGHILFYDLSHYLHAPMEVFMLRRGGLSSHGAIAGIVIAFVVFSRRSCPTYLPKGNDLLDIIAIGSAWAAGWIRIGNFFNQEVIGTVTQVPWAVIFGSPVDAADVLPRHPTQLYEACVAFALLIGLLILGRAVRWTYQGRIAGWYILILFTFRCFFEFFKAAQCDFDTTGAHMGQILSIPLLLWSLYLIFRSGRCQKLKEQIEPPHENHIQTPAGCDGQ